MLHLCVVIIIHLKARNKDEAWEERLFKVPNEIFYEEFLNNCKLFWDEVEVIKTKKISVLSGKSEPNYTDNQEPGVTN